MGTQADRIATALRTLAPKGGLRDGEIALIDQLGEAWEQRLSVAVEDGNSLLPSAACLKLIQEFEGCHKKRLDGRFDAYPDPGSGGDPWTIGWGSTGFDIRKGTIWTQEQCDERFAAHVAEFAFQVRKLLGDAPTTQNQFDALVSFAYNVGAGSLRGSTLLTLHEQKKYALAAEQFARWNKAAGKVMAGLTLRRAAEAKMYRGEI